MNEPDRARREGASGHPPFAAAALMIGVVVLLVLLGLLSAR